MEVKELTEWSKIDLNGLSRGWNDYCKNGTDYGGTTSPEREFDIAWKKMIFDLEIDHVEGAYAHETFLKDLPEVPDKHPFMQDRDAYIRKMLPTKEEWEAGGGNGVESY